MRPAVHIPRSVLDAMAAHAAAEHPNECCGMLAGKVAEGCCFVELGIAMVNELASPARFASEPRSLFRAVRRARELGLEVLAMYHSHPTSPPTPSRFDVADHNWGESVACVIVGPGGEVRAWWIREGGYEEAAVTV